MLLLADVDEYSFANAVNGPIPEELSIYTMFAYALAPCIARSSATMAWTYRINVLWGLILKY